MSAYLTSCPVPWCTKDDTPYVWQDAQDLYMVCCPSCGVKGPSGNTDMRAKEKWFDLPLWVPLSQDDAESELLDCLQSMALPRDDKLLITELRKRDLWIYREAAR